MKLVLGKSKRCHHLTDADRFSTSVVDFIKKGGDGLFLVSKTGDNFIVYSAVEAKVKPLKKEVVSAPKEEEPKGRTISSRGRKPKAGGKGGTKKN